MTHLSEENKKIKETVIDLQARSMRDNLVFSGIPESAEEDPEATVKNFIKTYLKLPEDTVENICFERVHRMGAKKPGAPRPRPIVAKFGYFKQKEQVEESRQGAERNRLRRKRPVPQRNPGATQNSVPNPTQVSFKRAPELSSQWTGSTWTDSSTATSVPLRGYINTTPDKYPLYLSFFFSLFPRLFFHLPITIGGATDHRWSVIRTDQSPRFGTHVIRGLTDKFNRVKVYHLHALRFCAQPLPRTLKRAHAEREREKEKHDLDTAFQTRLNGWIHTHTQSYVKIPVLANILVTQSVMS